MPELRLVVGYGPTEVTITTSGWTYDPAEEAGDVAPLGRLLSRTCARTWWTRTCIPCRDSCRARSASAGPGWRAATPGNRA